MTLKDFKVGVKKASTKKGSFEVNNSYGNKAAWRWLKKNKLIDEQITEGIFGHIIKTIHAYLQAQIIEGKDAMLPHKMGRLEVRKYTPELRIKDGKLVNRRCIDWNRTLNLWYEDEESYRDRTLVRIETPDIFRVYYNKACANYTNKFFYEFTPTRSFKLKLKERILNGNYDALLLEKNYGIFKCKNNYG